MRYDIYMCVCVCVCVCVVRHQKVNDGSTTLHREVVSSIPIYPASHIRKLEVPNVTVR